MLGRTIRISALALATAGLTAPGVAGAAGTLPDGRVYERVTPNELDGQAFGSAQGIANDLIQWDYIGPHAPAQAGTGVVYRSTRTASGWTFKALNTPPSPRALDLTPSPTYNRALTAFWWRAEALSNPTDGDFWRSSLDGPPHRVGLAAVGGVFVDGGVAYAVSDDGRSAAFQTGTRLVPEDTHVDTNPPYTNGSEVYVYDEHDQPRMVGVRNDGTLIDTCGAWVPNWQGEAARFLASGDLSTLFFLSRSCDGPAHLYARRDLTRTVDVSPSRRSTPDPAGPQARTFVQGTPDGDKVLFETAEQLVDDDTNSHVDLYQYDLRHDTLTWVTDDASADYRGVVRAADDQSLVYFVVTGPFDGRGAVGRPNLFVRTAAGATRLVTTLDDSDSEVWTSREWGRQAEATPDGRRLVFASRAALVASDTDQKIDLYGYDAPTDTLKKLSAGNGDFDVLGAFSTHRVGESHYLSDDGEYGLFSTNEPLDVHDGNDAGDVYRWRWSDNSTALVSAGYGGQNPWFIPAAVPIGVSPDGKDLFIQTTVPIDDSDTNGQWDIYDARLDGGFPRETPRPSCDGDECQGRATAPPASQSPATSRAGGPGDGPAPTRATVSVGALSQAALRTAARTGRLTIKAKVNVPGTVTASARATLDGGSRSVARTSRRLARAGQAQLVLALSRQARTALRRKGRLALAVDVRLSAAPKSKTLRVTLTRPRSGGAR